LPKFLDDFINKTLPDFWEQVKDLISQWQDKLGDNFTYAVVGAACLILLIIVAIAIGKANRRDRKYEPALSPIEEAIKKADYESIVNGNKNPVPIIENHEKDILEEEKTLSEVQEDYESTLEDEKTETGKFDFVEAAVSKPEVTEPEVIETVIPTPVQINMEKIELVKEKTNENRGTEMTYNTSRSGRTYTEEELIELIKE